MANAHPGFKAVQRKIAAKYGGNMQKAGAILAAASRKASPAAKAKNPRLKRVKGGMGRGKSKDQTVKPRSR